MALDLEVGAPGSATVLPGSMLIHSPVCPCGGCGILRGMTVVPAAVTGTPLNDADTRGYIPPMVQMTADSLGLAPRTTASIAAYCVEHYGALAPPAEMTILAKIHREPVRQGVRAVAFLNAADQAAGDVRI